MEQLIKERSKRAKWLLANIKHGSMATVNSDGSPHNSPYFFIASTDLTKLYWASHPESQHSRNILRTGKLFVVLYEANASGGLYIKAENGRIAEGQELMLALERYNQLRSQRDGAPSSLPEYYQGSSGQRMWVANTQQFWVNGSSKDSSGAIVRDYRFEIKRSDLVGSPSSR